MPIDSARVSKADGSQSLEVPAERGAVLRRAVEEFEQRVFLSTLNDIGNFCEAYAGSRNRGRKLARHAHDRQDKEGCEQRRIAAQAPGTLVATAFAHLPIGRGRKEPAERHEGHRRDGDGSSRDCVRTASVHTQATNNRGRLP